MCMAIFNTEGVHAVSDHYALNYHSVFSPTAHRAALALIRGHTRDSPTHFTSSLPLAGNELDTEDASRNIFLAGIIEG